MVWLQEVRQYTATSLLVRSSKKFKYMKEVLFSPFSTFLTTALFVYFLVVLKFSCSLTTTLKDRLGPLSSLKMRGYNQDLCLYERGSQWLGVCSFSSFPPGEYSLGQSYQRSPRVKIQALTKSKIPSLIANSFFQKQTVCFSLVRWGLGTCVNSPSSTALILGFSSSQGSCGFKLFLIRLCN